MKSVSTWLLLLALLVIARPSFADVRTTLPNASIDYCKGCQSGSMTLTLTGIWGAQVNGMVFDQATGRWFGHGRLDYEGYGVVVHESDAAFSVRMQDIDFVQYPRCVTQAESPVYAAHIEIRAANGNLVLVAGSPYVPDAYQTLPCPWYYLFADIGTDLPPTLAMLKPWNRNGRMPRRDPTGAPAAVTATGYRTISGRWITF